MRTTILIVGIALVLAMHLIVWDTGLVRFNGGASHKFIPNAMAETEETTWSAMKAAFQADPVATLEELLAEYDNVDPDSVWVEEYVGAKGQILKRWCKRIGSLILCVRIIYEPQIEADPMEGVEWVPLIGPTDR